MGDIDPSSVFVGACADMCPEKERYQREYQLRLNADYESTLAGAPASSAGGMPEVSHRFAVKDYSRSSADQVMRIVLSSFHFTAESSTSRIAK